MKGQQETITVEMIPVDQITVINPRIRNRKIFRQIVDIPGSPQNPKLLV